ncbi:hypothetical protein GCM10020000_14530 [Streptomyces olivoverticillatus]
MGRRGGSPVRTAGFPPVGWIRVPCMTWLITGGAGYIGAHVAQAMAEAGEQVAVYDDLSSGAAARLPQGVPLVQGSVLDRTALDRAFADLNVQGVVHLAAKKQVGESVEKPLLYYRENVHGLTVLLEAAVDAGVGSFVFSSSAAVYGMPDVDLVTEETPCLPINPYGETKLAGEWLVRAAGAAYGISTACLRYFNVASAARPELADTGVFNIIPMMFDRITRGERPLIFGTDYDTPRRHLCPRLHPHRGPGHRAPGGGPPPHGPGGRRRPDPERGHRAGRVGPRDGRPDRRGDRAPGSGGRDRGTPSG